MEQSTAETPRPLPDELVPAVTAALAEGGEELTFQVPMESPPPSGTQLVELTEISAMFSQPTPHGGTMTHNEPLPLRPGEVYRVKCRWCKGRGLEPMCAYHLLGYTDQRDLRSSCCCKECPQCGGDGHLDLKILTATPERWCEGHECGHDPGSIGWLPHGADDGRIEGAGVFCPACHGETPWSRWLYTAKLTNHTASPDDG